MKDEIEEIIIEFKIGSISVDDATNRILDLFVNIMDTETVTVIPKGEDFEIIVQHDQSGSAYGITLSKNAYEQLRQHFVRGSLPLDDEIINDCPQSSLGTREIWLRGVEWLKERVLKGNDH
jgi:hypothetical protein